MSKTERPLNRIAYECGCDGPFEGRGVLWFRKLLRAAIAGNVGADDVVSPTLLRARQKQGGFAFAGSKSQNGIEGGGK